VEGAANAPQLLLDVLHKLLALGGGGGS